MATDAILSKFNTAMNLQVRLDLNNLFPSEESNDLDFYITGISRQTLLNAILTILPVSDPNSEWQKWDILIFKKWFSNGNNIFALDVYRKILHAEEKNKRIDENGRLVFINKMSCLIFIEHILQKENFPSIDTISTLEIERQIFKAFLCINTKENKRSDIIKYDILEKLNLLGPQAVAIATGLSQDDIVNERGPKLVYIFTSQLIKALYLFEFLSENYIELLILFLKKYNCENFKEYINLFTPVVINSINNKNDKLLRFKLNTIEISPSDEKNKIFIENFIASPGDIDENSDFKYLRASPLIQYEINSYAIIHEVFAIQKIYNGLYFELNKLCRDHEYLNIKNFRRDITSHFAEKILLYKALNGIFINSSCIMHDGDKIEKDGFKGGPDFYIRNGNKIFLFENKDNLLKAEVKASYDIEKILQMIDVKMVNTQGIPQLVRNIKFTLNKKYPFDKNYNEHKCEIYPIIIVHRDEFDTMGLNNYIKSKFSEKIGELLSSGYNNANIKDVTIINIDTLMIFRKAFKERRIILSQAIEDYHQQTNKLSKYFKSEKDYNEKIQKYLDPFSAYVIKKYGFSKHTNLKIQMRDWLNKYFKPNLFQ